MLQLHIVKLSFQFSSPSGKQISSCESLQLFRASFRFAASDQDFVKQKRQISTTLS